MSPASKPAEVTGVLAAARTTWSIGAHIESTAVQQLDLDELAATGSGQPVPTFASHPYSAALTGGSTGRPRAVLARRPWGIDDAFLEHVANPFGFLPRERQLVITPLYHLGFRSIYTGLLLHQTIVLLDRFQPAAALDAIGRYRIELVRTVPTQMKWMLESAAIATADFTSLRMLHHSTARCPVWLKRAWIDLLGPARVYEVYSSREEVGGISITGEEWLEHPGSVGRSQRVLILDAEGRRCPAGEVGTIYVRTAAGPPQYIDGGPELSAVEGGYLSLGDLGFLDDDGYLHIVDRRADMFTVGGINVYPAEIEAVIAAYPGVRDVAVVGQPHAELGSAPIAYVEPYAGGLDLPELDRACRQSLSPAKVPVDYIIMESLDRDASGKLRRSALVE